MASKEALASVRKLNDVIHRFNAFNLRTEADPDSWSDADTREYVGLLEELDAARLDHSYYYPMPKVDC